MRIRIIDAFTDRPFAGDPAGVCLLDTDTWPDESWMRSIAGELRHSETAFAHPMSDGAEADWALRWFTPLVETNLCGHATLATAHALRTDGRVSGAVRFSTRSGVLAAVTHPDGTITLDFPAAPATPAPVPDGLAQTIGAEPAAAYGTGALGDLLVVLPDETTVRGLTPDLEVLGRVLEGNGNRGLIVTARAADADRGYDFVSRFFSPHQGIPEDPVTGSAHTALAPYWSPILGRDELVGFQASDRTGMVRASVHGDRVHLTGRAVTILDGQLATGSRPA